MKKISPSISAFFWIIMVLFLVVAIIFFFSPYRDGKMLLVAIVLLTLVITILWGIDYSHLNISYNDNFLVLKGYFSLRKLCIKIKDIEGYQIHQKADQVNGLHEEIQLITRHNGIIPLPKIAYKNYEDVKIMCENSLPFLGYNNLKYGQLIGKIIKLMFLVSGILAGLVGILKFL